MAANFSHTKPLSASTILQRDLSLWCGLVPWNAAQAQALPMPTIPETPDEHEARRRLQLAEQRTLLEHLKGWIRLRGLKQKQVAEALGVSEATVSCWIAGTQSMNVGQLRQIAVLLGAKPEDLLRSPAEAELPLLIEETLGLMERLSPQEWEVVLATARAMAHAKGKN